MRSTLTASFPDTGTIYRWTYPSDGMGGGTQAYSAIGTVACRISPYRHGGEPIIGERPVAVSQWEITVPYATDVTAADQIQSGGRTFEVDGLENRSWELGRRVAATELI